MAGTWGRVVLLAASAACSGCFFVAYHPVRTHETAVGAVAARVVSLDTIGNLAQVNVVLTADKGHRIANAWLTRPAADPCSVGATPSSQSPGVVRAEQRVLTFDLRAPAAAGLFTAAPTVIDLDVLPGDPEAPRRCLRISLTEARGDLEWTAWPRWFAAFGMRVVGAPSAADPIKGGVLFSFGQGAWVGPVRLRLDLLIGEAGTDRPPPAGYGNPRAELFGGDVAAEIFPLHVGWLGVGAQVGYEYFATDFHAQQGSSANDFYDAHGPRGPRAALRIARLPQPRGWPGFQTRPDHWSVGVDLFAARWTGLPGLAPMRYGVALSGEWGRWW